MTAPQPPGQTVRVVRHMNQSTRRCQNAVPANNKRTVNRRQFLHGLIHERIQNIALLVLVTVKGIQDQRLGVFKNALGVTQCKETTHRVPLAAFHRQLGRNRQHPLDHLRLHRRRQHLGIVKQHRVEFTLHVHHRNTVKLVALRHPTHATQTIRAGKNPPRQTDQHRTTQLREPVITVSAQGQHRLDLIALADHLGGTLRNEHRLETLESLANFHPAPKSVTKDQDRPAFRPARDFRGFLKDQLIEAIVLTRQAIPLSAKDRFQGNLKRLQTRRRAQLLHERLVLEDPRQGRQAV